MEGKGRENRVSTAQGREGWDCSLVELREEEGGGGGRFQVVHRLFICSVAVKQ